MEGDVLIVGAEKGIYYLKKEKKKNVCATMCMPKQEVDILNYFGTLYLHGVCLSRGSLPIGKDSPIVSTQYI